LVSLSTSERSSRCQAAYRKGDAGDHRAVWRGRDDTGVAVASCVYFARLETAGDAAMRKMVMIK